MAPLSSTDIKQTALEHASLHKYMLYAVHFRFH